MRDEKISCLVKFIHREKNLYLAEICARREDFMPHQNLHIVRRIYTSLKFRHREKNLYLAGIHALRESCIAKNHALRKITHCESTIMHDEKDSCLVKIHTSREDFMPRRNLDIARRIYTSLKSVHHEKNPCLVENHASRKNRALRKIMHCESTIMHDEKDSCLVQIYTSREEYMPR